MTGSLWRSPWPLRLLWVALPVTLGPALADSLGGHSRPVEVVGSVMAWLVWAVALGATAVPRSVSLTVVRLVVPGGLALSVWAALGSATAWSAVAGPATAALAVVLLAAPGVSDAFVDGSSYGAERRVALRVPMALLVLPVPLSWSVAAASAVAGPLLLATEQWALGTAAVLAGAVGLRVAVPQLHNLSRRWLVFVPAGIVVHDPLTLSDAVLFPRRLLERVGPALDDAGDDVVDATGGALGLVLEIRMTEAVTAGLRRGRDVEERRGVRSILVTPTRPAAVLDLAREARLPVG